MYKYNRPKQHSPEAETMLPAQPKMNTQSSHILSRQPGQDPVAENQNASRNTILAMIGTFIAGSALAGGIGYSVITGYNPLEKKSHPQDVPSIGPSASASSEVSDKPKPPDDLKTSEDLRLALNYYDIKVQPADFEKSSKGNYHLSGLKLALDNDSTADSGKIAYHWEPMESRKFNSFSKNDIVIATYVKNPRYVSLLGHIGIQPKAVYVDGKDSSVAYHYYRCVSPKSPGIASIVIRDPKRPSRNLTLFPLQLPVCTDESGPSANGGADQQ